MTSLVALVRCFIRHSKCRKSFDRQLRLNCSVMNPFSPFYIAEVLHFSRDRDPPSICIYTHVQKLSVSACPRSHSTPKLAASRITSVSSSPNTPSALIQYETSVFFLALQLAPFAPPASPSSDLDILRSLGISEYPGDFIAAGFLTWDDLLDIIEAEL